MREPSVRNSRRAIAGGILAAILVGAAGFVLGRSTMPREGQAEPIPETVAPSAPQPSVPQSLDRGAIIEIARRASDASASGMPAPPDLAKIVGRRFALALPFGCAGPAGADSTAPLRWRYDQATHALHVQVTQTAWEPQDWGLPPDGGASAQGFWISHPWSSSDTCPETSADLSAVGSGPVMLPGQTLAVASFGEAEPAAKTQSLEAVIKRKGEPDLPRGLRARITGRIDRAPGGVGPVQCVQPAGIEQHPICAIAVTFSELSVEDPTTGETLASWTIG